MNQLAESDLVMALTYYAPCVSGSIERRRGDRWHDRELPVDEHLPVVRLPLVAGMGKGTLSPGRDTCDH